ncbi:MAG: hypothetical protein LBP76_14125 [Treponema sp.]|jgi:hypothetical protein|nr:hypothetical protein [Treponema sp.]
MNEECYRAIKKKYGHWGSWALWDPADPYDPAIIERNIRRLGTAYVFAGLNVSRDLTGLPPWKNFHLRHRGSRERRLSCVLSGSVYEGSYMTDIIKDYPEANSGEVLAWIRKNPKKLEENIKIFLAELAFLEKKLKKIFVFGRAAAGIFKHTPALAVLPWQYITQFAAWGRTFEDTIHTQLGL